MHALKSSVEKLYAAPVDQLPRGTTTRLVRYASSSLRFRSRPRFRAVNGRMSNGRDRACATMLRAVHGGVLLARLSDALVASIGPL